MAQALPGHRNGSFPYDEITQPKKPTGKERDTAAYILAPGVDFYRPWISIPGRLAFVWPGGVEGFTCRIDPQLGIHRYIGDNAVVVDVTHRGQETISLTGTFPGLSSVAAFRRLRDVIYHEAPPLGYILYLPHLYPRSQRVFVQSASFDHPPDVRTRDLSYTIDFIRTGTGAKFPEPNLRGPTPIVVPGVKPRGKHPRVFRSNATLNTLRKIAKGKLGNAKRWNELYHKNEKYFTKLKLPMYQVADHRLKPGTKINY